jgi:hypothetical protein
VHGNEPITEPPDGRVGDPRQGLAFGSYYFAHDCGVPYEYNERWSEFFGLIADRIVSDLNPSSVLDAGCAIGMLVEALRVRGVDAYGIDVSDWAMANLAPGAVGYCRQASLAEPIEGRYDLVTCIEVIEHIPEPDTSRALANMCAASDRVLISTSPFDYGEPTHVSVRTPEDWAVAFSRHGFVHNLDFDASFITPWAVLFERCVPMVPDLVRAYERSLFRASNEAREVRATVLSLQARLAALEEATDEVALAELKRQVEAARLELLANRDELIGLEGELGEALGRAREGEAELERYRLVAQELESVRRSMLWRILVPYARFRRRVGRITRSIGTRFR